MNLPCRQLNSGVQWRVFFSHLSL